MAVGDAYSGVVAPRLNARDRVRSLGPVFFLVLAQLIFLLIATNQSTVIPGDWAPFLAGMELYLLMSSLAIGVFLQGTTVPAILEGNLGRFLKTFVIAAGVFWVLTLVFLSGTTNGVPEPVNGTFAFQYLIYVGVFIGPTEELLFRVVLPPLLSKTYLGQLVWSSLGFAFFHIGAYTAAGVQWTPETLFFQLAQVAFLGGVFFWVAWKSVDPRTGARQARWGYAAATGAHTAYDLTVLGVISGLGSVAAAAGLVAP